MLTRRCPHPCPSPHNSSTSRLSYTCPSLILLQSPPTPTPNLKLYFSRPTMSQQEHKRNTESVTRTMPSCLQHYGSPPCPTLCSLSLLVLPTGSLSHMAYTFSQSSLLFSLGTPSQAVLHWSRHAGRRCSLWWKPALSGKPF